MCFLLINLDDLLRTNKKHPHPGGDDVEMAMKSLRDLGKLPSAYDDYMKIEGHFMQNDRNDDGPDNAGSFALPSLSPSTTHEVGEHPSTTEDPCEGEDSRRFASSSGEIETRGGDRRRLIFDELR
ncbi:hypothetical protein Droror1_Dr00018457 [Drosera rotundifolia]